MILKLFSIFLISIGSFLEIYYYAFRFTGDGIPSWLAIIIGIALTLLLSIAVINRKKKWSLFIIIPIAAYSILCTSAGQSFSLSEERNQQTEIIVSELNKQDQIKEYQNDIELLNKELESLLNVSTVSDINERWRFEGVINRTEQRQQEIREEKKLLQEKINELRTTQIIREDVQKETTDIYKFYNKLFNINAGWLQFILQTLLSGFIAIMSPLGIITIQQKKEKRIYIKKKKIIKNFTLDQLKIWVRKNWIGIRSQKSNKILPKKSFLNHMNDMNINFPDTIYNLIFNKAIKAKVINQDGFINEKNEQLAEKRILDI